eukprot:PhF_6_TR19479/c0_g1_i1/m.28463
MSRPKDVSPADWNGYQRGVYYGRIAVQNVVTLTFDILEGQGIGGHGPEPQHDPEATTAKEMPIDQILNRDALDEFVKCDRCDGIFPANAHHSHDEVDDIVHHRKGEDPSTSLENAACLMGFSCCICTAMLSWMPYCVISCTNSSRRFKEKYGSKKEE